MDTYRKDVIVKALKRRKSLILLFSLLILALSAVKAFLFPLYESSTLILIDYPKEEPTSVEPERLPLREYVFYVGIHASLITSRPVIEKVIRDLGLVESSANKPEEQLERTIKKFQSKYISVTTKPLSSLVTVTVEYPDPKTAAEIANKIVEIYMDWNVNLLRQEANKVATFVEKELKAAKIRLDSSEEKLKKYKIENKIASLPEERTILLTKLADFKEEYYWAKVREEEIVASMEEINRQISAQEKETLSSVTIKRNPAINNLETRAIALEVELGNLLELYTEDSPQVIYKRKLIEQINQKIAEEVEKIKGAELANVNPIYQKLVENALELEKELVLAKIRINSLSSLIDEYEGKLKEISEKELELERLVRQVDIDKKTYFSLVEEREKNKLLKEKESIEYIKVISPATIPLKPKEGPTHVVLNTLVGLVVAMVASVVLEAKDALLHRTP